jgi:hypothetical protein
MPNVWIDSSITIFHDRKGEPEEIAESLSPEYLHEREMAERAAAKHGATLAARAAHQELAQLYAAQRRPNRSLSDDEGAPRLPREPSA